jgi:hypothetical protein
MTLPIEYSDLLTLVLALFAFIGLMRGWYKEGITSLFATALAILVWKPEMARKFIEMVNSVIKLFVMFFQAGFSLDPGKLVAQSVDPGTLIDPDSYRVYVVITVALLIASYFIGEATFKGKVPPLSRLLGGILGAFNGYMILSLIKEYMVNYMRAKNQLYVASDQLSIQMTEVPPSNMFAGPSIIFIFVVLIGVIALLIAGDRLKLPLK